MTFHVLHNPHANSYVYLNKSFAIDHNRYLINGEILACSFDIFRSLAISARRTHGCLKYRDQSRRHITVYRSLHVECQILTKIGIRELKRDIHEISSSRRHAIPCGKTNWRGGMTRKISPFGNCLRTRLEAIVPLLFGSRAWFVVYSVRPHRKQISTPLTAKGYQNISITSGLIILFEGYKCSNMAYLRSE